MTIQRLLGGVACAASIVLIASPASAQRAPSAYLQCDGNPNNVSPGETAARLLGAVTLLGLFAPGPEQPDQSARRFGAEGIAVCTELLGRETNDVRHAQLRLANAIHYLEASDHEGALAQLRQLSTDRPVLTQTAAFRLSYALSAIESEAQALLGLGRTREAADKAMEMAAAAPYDLLTAIRAHRFVQLTGEFGPAEQRYYANLVRLYPSALIERSQARQMAGDFAGGAEDMELWLTLTEPMLREPNMSALAQAALARGLAGDMPRAEQLAERARAALRERPESASAQATGELFDLFQILAMARSGNASQARLLFTGRTTWLRPSPAGVSEVARQLRQGAPANELNGALAGDPARFRAERLASLLQRAREQVGTSPPATPASGAAPAGAAPAGKTETPTSRLFSAIPSHWGERQLAGFSANTWRTNRSRYFQEEADERLQARLVNVSRDGFGVPAGYALLLHSALVARAEGHNSFMLLPAQATLGAAMVRTGNAGSGLIEAVSFNAEQVIADLSPLIPRPAPQR